MCKSKQSGSYSLVSYFVIFVASLLLDNVFQLKTLKDQNPNPHTSLDLLNQDNATLRIESEAQIVISTK